MWKRHSRKGKGRENKSMSVAKNILSLFFILFLFQSVGFAGPVVTHEIVNKKGSNDEEKANKIDAEKDGSDAASIKDELKKIEEKNTHSYNREGKPDPFAPFVLRHEASYRALSPKELNRLKSLQKTELQRITISDLRLVAVIKGRSDVWAMVAGPTGKGYVIKQGIGIGINGGVVDKIICEDKITPLGKEAIRKVVIKEPFIGKKGEVQFRYIDMVIGKKNGET